ncbi:MAG TPA: sensor histidine kinase [Pseudonocardiaceae bacterium]|nr:sensor histidine kinase [Pseudonocardiaceae bacterium]
MAVNGQPRRPGNGITYIMRGAGLFALSLSGAFLALWVGLVACLCFLGIGIPLAPSAFGAVRGLARVERRLALEWSGVTIPAPDRPMPDFGTGFGAAWRRTHWLIGDSATWRELLWTIVDPWSGALIPLVPAALVIDGVIGLAMPFIWRQRAAIWHDSFYGFIPLNSEFTAILSAILGVVQIIAAPLVARSLVRSYFQLTRKWLRPTENELLNNRVRHLTQTRSSVVDTQAAELRRIERDLHDGAQVRLVAMGMTLSAAESLLDKNPGAARALLTEAKANSAKALSELRDLVRGIHPPVLADRGIADAVRALAMDCPLHIDVTSDLPGRLVPPVESAAYFTVSELLNNVVKHAHAQKVGVAIGYRDDMLRIEVTDDGCGGADPSRGSGLRGVEERLAAFDGYLSVLSPPGGPTLCVVCVPCGLIPQNPPVY